MGSPGRFLEPTCPPLNPLEHFSKIQGTSPPVDLLHGQKMEMKGRSEAGTMTLERVFELVRTGRLSGGEGHAWICLICYHHIGSCASPDERDQRALKHCLLHASGSPISRLERPKSFAFKVIESLDKRRVHGTRTFRRSQLRLVVSREVA